MHQIALQLGPLTLRWYGVLVTLGFVAGIWSASRRAMKAGVPGERILDLGPWLVAGALVGARLLYVITFWKEQFAEKPWWEVFMIQHGGLVYYGGLIGSSLAFILAAKFYRLPLWPLADILAPSIALGYAFGRLGCLMNGCCYGRPTTVIWGIHFPPDHASYPDAVHPTQVYESMLSLCLYVYLAWLFKHRKFPGQIFAAYLVGYAFLRSFVEYFRGDYPAYQRFFGGLLTPAQMVSIVILVTGLALFAILPRLRPSGGQTAA